LALSCPTADQIIQVAAIENASPVTIPWRVTYLLNVKIFSYFLIRFETDCKWIPQTLQTPMNPSTWTPAATKAIMPRIREEKLGAEEPTTVIS
jgi:hypothetical protein